MSPCLTVVAVTPEREVARLGLGHGEDPGALLGSRGWHVDWLGSMSRASRVELTANDPWSFEFVFPVRQGPRAPVQSTAVPHDPGLNSTDLVQVRPFCRVAAYAVISSDRGVLLTQLSAQTNSPGSWTLPGGGLDQGEVVGAGLAREVWEESGAQISDVELLGVLTNHWVGRSPLGWVEDYHAVRIVHRAVCLDPQEPVVHDVGGSTSDARWVAWEELDSLPLVPVFASVLGHLAWERRASGE